jgi:hypothetical protein
MREIIRTNKPAHPATIEELEDPPIDAWVSWIQYVPWRVQWLGQVCHFHTHDECVRWLKRQHAVE